jgi:hypothetical protein
LTFEDDNINENESVAKNRKNTPNIENIAKESLDLNFKYVEGVLFGCHIIP